MILPTRSTSQEDFDAKASIHKANFAVHAKSLHNRCIQDQFLVQEMSGKPLGAAPSPTSSFRPLEMVQNFLRRLRDKLFGGFLTIDANLEQQKLQTIVPIISQLEKASSNKSKAKQIVDSLPGEARQFVETGIRKLLLSNPQRFKKYAHPMAFLEERPQSKEILDLLRKFANSRREIVALARLVPYAQDRSTPLSSLIDHFRKLPESLRKKILLSLDKIDHPSKLSIEKGRLLLLRDAVFLRTAVATAVRGLKLYEDENTWHQNAWRCQFWYA